jgi:hypothetical protein
MTFSNLQVEDVSPIEQTVSWGGTPEQSVIIRIAEAQQQLAKPTIGFSPSVTNSFQPTISIDTENGVSYSVEVSDTPDGTYTEIGTISGDGTIKTFIDERTPSSRQFYKVLKN